jgi:hypothetical protein
MNLFENQTVYMSLREAKEVLQSRWEDDHLKKKVQDYFGVNIPIELSKKPHAILVRDIATPDIECMRFLELSKEISLSPIVFEGISDKFASLATDKMGLAKLSFFDGYDKNGGVRNHYRKIVDIPKFDGKPFKDVYTLWGENLVDFHHRILRKHILQEEIDLFDDLEWYKENVCGSMRAKEYYRILMAFFVVHGIQFENYITDDNEQEFFDEVVKPAFDFVTEKFGVKPLIVSLAPNDEARNPYWWCYRSEIEQDVQFG